MHQLAERHASTVRWQSGRRAWNILGNEFREFVREANAIALRVAELMLVASMLGIYIIVEQPATSLLWRHPAMARIFTRCAHNICSDHSGKWLFLEQSLLCKVLIHSRASSPGTLFPEIK